MEDDLKELRTRILHARFAAMTDEEWTKFAENDDDDLTEEYLRWLDKTRPRECTVLMEHLWSADTRCVPEYDREKYAYHFRDRPQGRVWCLIRPALPIWAEPVVLDASANDDDIRKAADVACRELVAKMRRFADRIERLYLKPPGDGEQN